MPEPRRIAIVMSRLPRLIEPHAIWLRGLRAALRRIQESRHLLVVSTETAGSDFVRRGAQRLQIPVQETRISSDPTDASSILSSAVPPQDRALLATADLAIALQVRTNGNTHVALRDRLAAGGPVELVDLPNLQPHAVRDDLLGKGATLWCPSTEAQNSFRSGDHFLIEIPSVCELVPQPSRNDWTFLSHTTRARAGPWPEQTTAEYIDSIFDNAPAADHSPIAALERIVTQQRLLAASRMIRGGHEVVCLTAVPLMDLPSLRKFQTHRSRWDFEPYGICIRQRWLRERGTRPVIYGDDTAWDSLSELDRPFFQFTSPSESSQGTDWSIEQEWRHQGDLDLSELPPDEGLLFVRRYQDALRLSKCSRWPITLWPDSEATDSR